MRGKAATRQQRKVKKIGSPPPMRGKVPIHDTVFFHVGITPAYAGKSMELSSNIMVSKDHPRLCGEKASTKAWELWGTGSPPPMRGKAGYRSRNFLTFRITPAYAGKRQTVISSDVAKRDHPRLCGEKFLCRSGRMSSTGSPPPMRGKVRWRTRLLPRSGINVINLTSSQAS